MSTRPCKLIKWTAPLLLMLCLSASAGPDPAAATQAPAQATRSFAPRKVINYREPARRYVERKAGSWTVQLESELAERLPGEADKVIKRLELKLEQTVQLLPDHARERLRGLSLFVLLGSQAKDGGYDSGSEYFRRTDPDFHLHLDPRWRDALVIYSASNYLWQDEHWSVQLLVHELSHAWHLEQWPEKQTDILSAWQQAIAGKLYHGVKDVNGTPIEKSYAASNQLEYFAELSCAYFWRGEYEPLNREALQRYDPPGFAMIEKMWGIHAPPPIPSERAGQIE